MARRVGTVLLWLVVAACLAAAIIPRYLDRRYWRGPVSGHYDGQRFSNPADDEDGHAAEPPGGGSRVAFMWRNLTGRDGRPDWPDTVPVRAARPGELLPTFPATMRYAPASPAVVAQTPMRATWVGHATVLVQTPGLNILTDPIWSERTGPFGLGPRRAAAPGIAFADLPPIQLVLVSHNHYDHLDLATLKRLWQRDRPLIVTAPGNGAILRSAGIPAVAADWGQAVTVEARPRVSADRYATDPVRVIATRTHHWSSRWLADRNRALWSGFVVTLPGGNLFFAGDTGLGDGRWPAEAAALGPIRLALIPIGAFRFGPGQMSSDSHIGPSQAVEVLASLNAATALPMHWGTFRLSWEGYRTPADLLRLAMRCARIPVDRFAPVAIGRPVAIPPIGRAPRLPHAEAGMLERCMDTPAGRAMR